MDLLPRGIAHPKSTSYYAAMGTYGERAQAALAAEIRAEMAVKRISQSALGREVGIAQSSLSRYLANEPRDIPFQVLMDIAKALGVTPHELVERAERRVEREDAEGDETAG